MGTNQPYDDEPQSEDDYVVNETVTLEDTPSETPYASWEIDTSTNPHLRGRAIARGGESIQLILMESDEFEYYEKNEEFWFENRSDHANSIKFEERVNGGDDHILVVEADQGGNGQDGIEVTVEVWER
jgi:hypothetical protein